MGADRRRPLRVREQRDAAVPLPRELRRHQSREGEQPARRDRVAQRVQRDEQYRVQHAGQPAVVAQRDVEPREPHVDRHYADDDRQREALPALRLCQASRGTASASTFQPRCVRSVCRTCALSHGHQRGSCAIEHQQVEARRVLRRDERQRRRRSTPAPTMTVGLRAKKREINDRRPGRLAAASPADR